MKTLKLIVILLIGMTVLNYANAQDSIAFKSKYKCWMYSDSGYSSSGRMGVIYSVADSGINFSAALYSGNVHIKDDRIIQYIPSSVIDRIKIRKKGNVGWGILIGGGVGFLFGGAIGFASTGGDDFFTPEKAAVILGTLFTIPGMIIGGAIGTTKIEIPINRKQNRYKRQKEEIRSYAIIQ